MLAYIPYMDPMGYTVVYFPVVRTSFSVMEPRFQTAKQS